MNTHLMTWIGGEHEFLLDLPMIEAVQSACGDTGIRGIMRRIETDEFKSNDIICVVAYALHGGGMAKIDAFKLVRENWETGGFNGLLDTAYVVLGFCQQGWPQKETTAREETDDGKTGVKNPTTS